MPRRRNRSLRASPQQKFALGAGLVVLGVGAYLLMRSRGGAHAAAKMQDDAAVLEARAKQLESQRDRAVGRDAARLALQAATLKAEAEALRIKSEELLAQQEKERLLAEQKAADEERFRLYKEAVAKIKSEADAVLNRQLEEERRRQMGLVL